MNSFFKIDNLSTGYSLEAMAIRHINLEIPKNKICAVLGSNGAGKTTLLKAIMGILPAYQGQIFLEDVLLNGCTTEHRASLGIGYVPQGRFIFPQLTVEENLLLGCEVKNINTKKAKEISYGFFPALAEISKRKGGMLSGGQQQQLAIARMLVMEPRLLILDEPAEGIQPNIVQNIGAILKKVSEDMNITVLLVEQFVSFALNLAHRYYWMQSGEINKGGEVNAMNKKNIMESITL
jgi:urea transport system ATP-binding protein